MAYKEPSDIDRLELLALGPRAIEAQERRGQGSFVRGTELPVKGSETKEAQASPVRWGEVNASDPMFREANLPEGWKKIATDHAMWSDLVDDKGRKRAGIFYKAAFYDRDAFIRFNVRYYVTCQYGKDDSVTLQVIDCGQGPEPVVIYSETPELPNREQEREAYYKAVDETEKRASAWLVERYPEHRDPNAYWDAG